MTDSSPSVPVESREQPRDALKQQMERRLWADGGVIINSRKVPEESVRQMREYAARTCASVTDATIRELRAECAREFEHLEAELGESEGRIEAAQAIHVKAFVEAPYPPPEMWQKPSDTTRRYAWADGFNAALAEVRAALAAHLEAEQAEEAK